MALADISKALGRFLTGRTQTPEGEAAIISVSPVAAAPAWTSSAVLTNLGEFRYILFGVDYIPTGAGGQLQYRMRWADTAAGTQRIDQRLVANVWQDDLTTSIVTAVQINTIIRAINPGGYDYLVLDVQEVGLPGAPGDVDITIRAQS